MHGSHRKTLLVVSLILVAVVLVSALFVYRSLVVDNDDAVDDGIIRVRTAIELRDAINNAGVKRQSPTAHNANNTLTIQTNQSKRSNVTITCQCNLCASRNTNLRTKKNILSKGNIDRHTNGIIVTHEAVSTGFGVSVAGLSL